MPIKSAGLPTRRHTRLADSAYYGRLVLVTICTHQRRALFGVVAHGEVPARVELTVAGDIVRQEWMCSRTASGVFVVMPDHIHGIVRPVHGAPLAGFVRGFKSAVTSRVRREVPDERCHIWQRGYHDRILREDDIVAACRYVAANPSSCRGARRAPRSGSAGC